MDRGSTGAGAARGGRALPALFGVTSFLAASLIFVVQPLVARTLLPVLGGSASVWNSAMLTFQVLLLAGYLVAHLAATRLRGLASNRALLALALVSITGLPIGLREGWAPGGAEPALWTLWAVGAAVGLPFLALSCVSPTLQRWYGALRPDHDPYVLYATGNAGSFIGLLAYPLVIERTLGISEQQTAWTVAYLIFVALFLACGRVAGTAPTAAPAAADPAAAGPRTATRRDLLRWTAMAAGPSLLLLGVTRHLATDVAAIPLLWVVPLSIYLLTFVIAFSGRGTRAVDLAGRLGILLGGISLVSLVAVLPTGPGLILPIATFSCLTLAVHGRLAAERPALASLTAFYLAMSTGGAIGGLVGGLLAPVAFRAIWEYPLGIVACVAWLTPQLALPGLRRALTVVLPVALIVAGAVRIATSDTDAPPRGVQVLLGLAVVATLAWAVRGRELGAAFLATAVVAVALPGAGVVAQERTYYGVTRVLQNAQGWHLLASGTTVHGGQDPARPELPLTYFAPGSPLADIVELGGGDAPRSVGVIGLGAGALAAGIGRGEELTYYEIDPAVIDIATDPSMFSFVADSAGEVHIVEGDGRLAIAAEPEGVHDLIVVDAFSSDAIPVHLLTREALATYRRALRADGVVAFHISNRYFDLAPVVAALARDVGLEARHRAGIGTIEGSLASAAVVVGTPEALAPFDERGWVEIESAAEAWTDDHADTLAALQSP